jgi:Flp pilus assembly protein TadD
MKQLAHAFILCICAAGILTNTAVAKSSSGSTRDGFWTKSVQASPDLEACRQAVLQHPNDAIANNDYGWSLRMNAQLPEAAKYLQKAISLNPSMSQPYSNLSVVMLELGNIEQAVSNANKAVSLEPNQAVYRVVLGNALTKQHRLDEAVDQYRKALHLKSNYENAYYHLAEALSLKGNTVAAQKELSTALALDGNDERASALMDKLSTVKQPH